MAVVTSIPDSVYVVPEQDFVVLGGEISPGRATITGAGSPRTWDVRKGPYMSGASIAFQGRELAKFDIVIDLWKPQHFIAWETFARVLEPVPADQLAIIRKMSASEGMAIDAASRIQALSVDHPLLMRKPLHITACVVTDCSQFEQDEDGLFTCRVSCLEFRRPVPTPVLASPTRAIPAAASQVPTAQSEADRMMLDLKAEFARLSAKFP